tara:strand:- start:1680 stop:3962 length:2283 start_codon:yes stop_codon:yes gene_type:complete
MNKKYGMQDEYRDAGFRVFGLHGVTNGLCECGNDNCQAHYKHPTVSNWQYTPVWNDDQWVLINELKNDFKTGFGVLCDGYLVIDIDPRNGGNEGFDKLVADTGIDFKDHAEFSVSTGGGGWHLYYKYSGEEKLHSSLKVYEGVDFKSSGFVVGAGSMHASGNPYEVEEPNMEDITELPEVLKALLTKPVNKPNSLNLTYTSDVGEEKIVDMLECLKGLVDDYEQWIQIGMIIHDSLGNGGFNVWNRWSQYGEKYNENNMQSKWLSFGKSKLKMTVATLIQMAKKHGYKDDVTFPSEAEVEQEHIPSVIEKTIDGDIDHTKAPGLVGECIDYVNSQSRYPRKSLAVSAALMAVSNIGGLRFKDDMGVTPNLFCFNIAASSTGKESIQQAQNELMFAAGMGKVCYGAIKSEQEIYRNMTRNQAACYTIDEWGIQLKKITTSKNDYMGGVVGSLMEIYSKANKKLMLGADFAESNIAVISKELAAINKRKDNSEPRPGDPDKKDSLEEMLNQLNNGHIARPFISLAGYSTQATFNDLMTYEQATNGFIGRALIFEEKESHPDRYKKEDSPEMSDYLAAKILTLRNGGNFQMAIDARVEFNGKLTVIKTAPDALEMLDVIYEEIRAKGTIEQRTTGLEAIVRRCYELVLKVSMILAMGDGQIRTVQHVQWAYSLMLKDIDNKLALTAGNRAADEGNLRDELYNKVLQKLDKKSGMTLGTLSNKMRKIDKDNIKTTLDYLVSTKKARFERVTPKKGAASTQYYLI